MGDLKVGNLGQVPFANSGKIEQKAGVGFDEAIKGAIARVSTLEREADTSIVNMLQGKADINQTMIALQKVDISMRLVLAIRNRVIEAYREVMHMQF